MSDGSDIFLTTQRGMDVDMNGMQTRRLNGLQRLNRKLTLNPLIRTKLIWVGRIWMVNLLQILGKIIEGIFKAITKIALVILTALLFM